MIWSVLILADECQVRSTWNKNWRLMLLMLRLSVIKSWWLWRIFHTTKTLFLDERFREIHYISHASNATTTRQISAGMRGFREQRKRMENSFLRFVIVSQASIVSHSAPSEVLFVLNRKKKYRKRNERFFFSVHFLFHLSHPLLAWVIVSYQANGARTRRRSENKMDLSWCIASD